jgi:hypothetical protein
MRPETGVDDLPDALFPLVLGQNRKAGLHHFQRGLEECVGGASIEPRLELGMRARAEFDAA